METVQRQNLETRLTLTPQMARSLEILQCASMDLHELTARELNQNPALEDMADSPDSFEKPVEIGAQETPESDGLDDDYPDTPAQEGGDDAKMQSLADYRNNSIAERESLGATLMHDAAIDLKTPAQERAFEFLLNHMDSRGFLPEDIAEHAKHHNVHPQDFETAFKLLRASEPAGIGALNMRDCLMLQLERRGRANSLAYAILEDNYDLLLKRRVPEIAQAQNRTAKAVEDAIAEIATLNTSPARDWGDDTPAYISADLRYFRREDGQMDVELTNEYIPKLRINPEYRMMAASHKLRKGDEEFIKGKIRDGKNFIDAIEQRQQTLLKIGRAILEKQRAFFDGGVDALKAMTMQDIADEIGVHPATVSRAIAGKYAETPKGTVELKFFFNSGYENSSGESVARESVKDRIREIVANEDTSKPLSDAKIAEILSSEGLDVARRTVAKYREELGIAHKSLRKRF